MRKSLNSSKNNKLPSWNDFFYSFARYQYYLYSLVFPKHAEEQSRLLKGRFEKCRKNNINAIWAAENLYIAGNTEEQFVNILRHNLKPVYDAARLQGYDVWNTTQL